MKNREKYSHEILKTIMGANSCDFMKDTVAPLYLDSRESGDAICKKIGCTGCMKLFAFWLDGEYNKPPTGWVNVPVDTLVRVRDSENEKKTETDKHTEYEPRGRQPELHKLHIPG